MAKSKKLTSGEGWSLISSDASEKAPVESLPPEQHKIRCRIEKRAKGKTVTVISPLVLTPTDTKQLSKQLKNTCGTGGTDRDGEIELQGDCRDRATEWLKQKGWGVRS